VKIGRVTGQNHQGQRCWPLFYLNFRQKKAHHRGWAKTTHSNSSLYSGEKGCLKISSLISNIGNMLFTAAAGVFKNPLISLKLIIFSRLFLPLHPTIQYEK